jgi:hypothetical protein
MRSNKKLFLASLLALGSMGLMGGRGFLGKRKRQDDLDNIDIEKEAKLIQEKKSRLSASQRRRVMILYEEKRRSQSCSKNGCKR